MHDLQLSIRARLLLLSVFSLSIVAVFILAMNVRDSSKSIELASSLSNEALDESSKKYLMALASDKAALLDRIFGNNMAMLSALQSGIGQLYTLADNDRLDAGEARAQMNELLHAALGRDADTFGTWLVMKPGAMHDERYRERVDLAANASGRVASYWNRKAGEIINEPISEATIGNDQIATSGVPNNSWYTCPLETGRTCVMEPFKSSDSVLMTTIAEPIKINGEVIGAVGVDVSLRQFQDVLEKSRADLFAGQGDIIILSPVGLIAGYSKDRSKLGESAGISLANGGQALIDLLKSPQPQLVRQGTQVRAVYPVTVQPGAQPWGVIVDVPAQVLGAAAQRLTLSLSDLSAATLRKSLGMGALALLVGALLMWLMAQRISRPILDVARMLR